MKISSLQENLKNGLFLVSRIAGKNVNLPILNNIMIKAKGNNIKLISTNLEIGIIVKIRGKIEKEGEYTVDAKVINDYVSLLPNKKVDIEKKDKKLKVVCDNYKTNIRGQEADEYPLIPNVEKKEVYRAEINDFKEALSQVVFAVSTSETRIELNGVLFSFNKDNIYMAATDSYRLAEKRIKIKPRTDKEEVKKIIIPAKTLQELLRILSAVKTEEMDGEKKEIEFTLSENQILFSVENVELVSRLVEGQYPDYKQIIPTASDTTAILDREELVRAVKASAIFSKTGINDINLDLPLGKNKLIITSASSQTGENVAEVAADSKGKDNGIVLNYRYLLDSLNNINSSQVKIEITDGNTPCVVKPDKDDSLLYIVMPIKQ